MTQAEYMDLLWKALAAFLVTLGWALILYPAARKVRGPWYTLILSSALLSFVIFFIREKLKSVSPLFEDIFTYFLGVFFGAAILSLIFNFNLRWLAALPLEDSAYKGKNNLKKLHLRHIVKIAIILEEKGNTFYEGLANRAGNPDVKNLCNWLAGQELEHKKLLENILFDWLPLPVDNKTLSAYLDEFRNWRIFMDIPSRDAAEADMVKYAIEQEIKMADFYLSLEKNFPRDWKRLRLQMLVMEERSHAHKLVNMYPQFSDLAGLQK